MTAQLYTHPDNKNKTFVDWREPEHRMEGFLRWLKWRMNWSDLDHYMCNNTYRDTRHSSTKKPMTEEQTYWFSLIFGMTYQSEMAWVIYNEFPDFWDIDLEKLQDWNVKNLSRQKYAKDCKYNKGRITDQVASMREVIKPSGSIKKFFEDLVEEDEGDTFTKTYSVVKEKFYKFGRMTSWLACQTLFETANYPARPCTMLASDPSSWSVRSGLMYAYNRDEMIEAKNKGVKITQNDKEWIDFKEQELLDKSLEYLGDKYNNIFTHYLLESHLCQYKKLMLGGDYAGHSSGDHVSRASWLAEQWPEVNFDAFFTEATQNHHVLVRGCRESKGLRNLCALTGQMINMHLDYDDMPDVYKEMDINKDWLTVGKDADRKIEKQIETYAKNQGLLVLA
jgi:hypothetical protein